MLISVKLLLVEVVKTKLIMILTQTKDDNASKTAVIRIVKRILTV